MDSMSYISSYFHCVFSTKERRRLITPELRERLWPFLGGIARQNKMKAIEIGGVEDHVHILLSLPSHHGDFQGVAIDQGRLVKMDS
jgi:REP element-mobilizing transposase RayT